ncbi:MAG: hypothetical protein MJD61_08035 [Proteobacteria bacterium]|nr:hypothetical protein [Pseudomonadota bacterium]
MLNKALAMRNVDGRFVGWPGTCFTLVAPLPILLGLAQTACDSKQGRANGQTLGDRAASELPVRVEPPFRVSDDSAALLFTWFDERGVHVASKRSEIPEPRRQRVRVTSLGIEPDRRLDPDQVYVADLRETDSSGTYPVYLAAREQFERWVAQSTGERSAAAKADKQPVAGSGGNVVLYMASWCGVCRSAAAYFRQREVAFVEKDIEKDPSARGEMQRKAAAAGVTPRGVPVIDFRGTLLLGFDRSALERLIAGP